MSNINNIESSLRTSFSFGPSAFSSDNLSPKFRSAQNRVTDADVASAAALTTREQVVVVVVGRGRTWAKPRGLWNTGEAAPGVPDSVGFFPKVRFFSRTGLIFDLLTAAGPKVTQTSNPK